MSDQAISPSWYFLPPQLVSARKCVDTISSLVDLTIAGLSLEKFLIEMSKE